MLKRLIAKSPLRNNILKGMGMFGHLPKYFIAGVGRSGTTTVYDYMVQHPDIDKSQQKENWYFDHYYDRGLRWYKGFFPKPNCIDATPSYYRSIKALERIKKDITNPKFIIILREPVARFESTWNFSLKWTRRTFNEIFNQSHDLVQHGVYHSYLKIMFDLFGRDNIHVMFLETFKEDPIRSLNYIFDFLEISKFNITNVPIKNKGKYIIRLSDYQRSLLETFYTIPNRKLSLLLHRTLPWSVQ